MYIYMHSSSWPSVFLVHKCICFLCISKINSYIQTSRHVHVALLYLDMQMYYKQCQQYTKMSSKHIIYMNIHVHTCTLRSD